MPKPGASKPGSAVNKMMALLHRGAARPANKKTKPASGAPAAKKKVAKVGSPASASASNDDADDAPTAGAAAEETAALLRALPKSVLKYADKSWLEALRSRVSEDSAKTLEAPPDDSQEEGEAAAAAPPAGARSDSKKAAKKKVAKKTSAAKKGKSA